MIAVCKRIGILALLIPFLLVGCETTGGGSRNKTVIGGLGGAAAGGLLAAGLGGNAATIAGATVLGGLVGGAIGDRMDAADRREANAAAARALDQSPSGSSVAWNNPDSGNQGTITPTRTYQNASGQYCREYQQNLTIDGKAQRSYGTACRQPDGSWKIVS